MTHRGPFQPQTFCDSVTAESVKHSSQELNLRLRITLSRVNRDLWVLFDFCKGKKKQVRGKDRQNYLLTFHCPVKFVFLFPKFGKGS